MAIMDEWREINKLNQALGQNLEAWDFLKLARKFSTHDPYKCNEENCMVCTAIGTIVNTQDDIAHAEYEKNREHSEDLMGSAPF